MDVTGPRIGQIEKKAFSAGQNAENPKYKEIQPYNEF